MFRNLGFSYNNIAAAVATLDGDDNSINYNDNKNNNNKNNKNNNNKNNNNKNNKNNNKIIIIIIIRYSTCKAPFP